MFSPMLILAGLGLFALFGAFTFWDDDDEAAQPSDPQPIPPDEGTKGDDTITDYDHEADEDVVLSTLGGDDLVQLATVKDSQIDLGDGNDTIDGGIYDQTAIDGGEGGDVVRLDRFDDVTIEAGSGDDRIILSGPQAAGGDDSLYISDDDGNDTVRIQMATASPDHSNGGDIWIESGSGSDTYELTLVPNADAALPLPGDEDHPGVEIAGHPYAAVISNFETGVDKLVIDPTTLAGDATYTGYEITTAFGTGYTEVVFHYTHPDYPQGLAVAVGATGTWFVESDIEIVSGLPTLAA